MVGTGTGNEERCYWLFDLAVDADERLNLYEQEEGVVATMTAMINSYAKQVVTCEEAQTCGPVDPAAEVKNR